MMTIQIKGGKDVLKNLMKYPEVAKRHYARAVDVGAQILRDDTKKMPAVSASRTGYDAKGIPVDTSRMRTSINKRKIALLAAGVRTNTKYGVFVHEGTKKMKARPFFEWALKDFGVQKKIDDLFAEASHRIAIEVT
jgi:HK97 gp10 family phage protein